MNELQSFWKTPKGMLLAILLGVAAIAGVHEGAPAVANVAAGMGGAIIIDICFAVLQEHKRIFPDGAALTGLIVAMVLGTNTPWYLCAVTAGLGIAGKHLLKIKRKPIFNPAAFGLAAAILLFHTGQSWWGGFSLLAPWWTVLLVAAGMLITDRVNKFPLVLSFLGIYFALILGLAFVKPNMAADALRMPFTTSVLYLAFFMVTDPPTSPAKPNEQVLFGAIAAVVSVADYVVLNGLSFLLLGLLVANAYNGLRLFVASRAPARPVAAKAAQPNS